MAQFDGFPIGHVDSSERTVGFSEGKGGEKDMEDAPSPTHSFSCQLLV
jgi:hypothetical protein